MQKLLSMTENEHKICLATFQECSCISRTGEKPKSVTALLWMQILSHSSHYNVVKDKAILNGLKTSSDWTNTTILFSYWLTYHLPYSQTSIFPSISITKQATMQVAPQITKIDNSCSKVYFLKISGNSPNWKSCFSFLYNLQSSVVSLYSL